MQRQQRTLNLIQPIKSGSMHKEINNNAFTQTQSVSLLHLIVPQLFLSEVIFEFALLAD